MELILIMKVKITSKDAKAAKGYHYLNDNALVKALKRQQPELGIKEVKQLSFTDKNSNTYEFDDIIYNNQVEKDLAKGKIKEIILEIKLLTNKSK